MGTPVNALWRNREFNLLWSSQSLSDLGGAIAMLAVPLLVLEVTGSAESLCDSAERRCVFRWSLSAAVQADARHDAPVLAS